MGLQSKNLISMEQKLLPHKKHPACSEPKPQTSPTKLNSHHKTLTSMEETVTSDYSNQPLPPKKRPYMCALAFSETEPETSPTESSPQTKHDQEENTSMGKKIFPESLQPEIVEPPKTRSLEEDTNDVGSESLYPPKKRICLLENNEEVENLETETMSHQATALFDYMERSMGEKGIMITDKRLFMKKGLEMSDIERQQARLALPGMSIDTGFLTDSEKRSLLSMNKKARPIKVKVIGSLSLQEHTLEFTRWDYAKSNKHGGKRSWKYVLKDGWNNILAANKLDKLGQLIEVWTFRREGRLCFAIVDLQKQVPVKGKPHKKKKNITNPRPLSLDGLLTWKKTCPRTPRLPVLRG